MGARQSRRSVDITTTPKKEGLAAEGGVVSDAAAPGDGKLERIEESDAKPTTNGIAPHTDVAEDKDKDKDDATEKDKDKEKSDEAKPEETKQEPAGESPAETAEVTTPTEAASPNAVTSPESKETKKKDKMKKKWSFRSISFSKKDKSKPAREEAPKNGDVTKEEPLTEGGEEAENGSATAGSPVEEKSAVSSPTAENEASPTAVAPVTAVPVASTPSAETKEERPASPASSPADDKQEEPTPSAPTPVPVEEKKEEVEKVEAEKKAVEVSPAGGQFVAGRPVEVFSVFQVQTLTPPSIIERKTSEDIPSQPPSSPPPTPIDSSPLQQAQQAVVTATALAEVFKVPAEAADKEDPLTRPVSTSSYPERNDDDPSTPTTIVTATELSASPADVAPRTELNTVPTRTTEALPVVDTDVSYKLEIATVENLLKSHSDSDDKEQTEVQNPTFPLVESTDADNPRAEDTLVSESKMEHEHVKEIPPPSPLEKETMDLETSGDVESGEKFAESSNIVTSDKVGIVEQPSSSSSVLSVAEKEVSRLIGDSSEAKELPIFVKENTPPESMSVVEQEEKLAEQVMEQLTEAVATEEAQSSDAPPNPDTDTILKSEEGPVPLSDEVVVEAKPAVVIPDTEEEEVMETAEDTKDVEPDAPKLERTESVEIIVEDKLEMEVEPDIVITSEEILVLEEPEDSLVHKKPPERRTSVVIEKEDGIEILEIAEGDDEEMPPPLPGSSEQSLQKNLDSKTVPFSVADDPKAVNVSDVERNQDMDEFAQSLPEEEEISPNESFTSESSVPQTDTPCPPNKNDAYLADELQTASSHCSPSNVERVPSPTDDLPPAPQNIITTVAQYVDTSKYYPINASQMQSELPASDETAPSPRHPTETTATPLTPPRSPTTPHSNVSIASGLTTSTKDSTQTQSYDDQSNREFKMESVSISLNSYNESDLELKERLAESLAATENKEESSVPRQLSNNATSSTTVQETHQSVQEPEAPIKNNVPHDSTTVRNDETSKITPPPVIPTNEVVVPASPPSAPAIMEDVASVAKAIGELEISDKIVAAASMECNTNEIITDAPYQNDMKE